MNLPFQGLLPGLMSRKFDFVATSVGITPERARRFAFTQPVGVVRSVLMVRVDDASIKQDTDIAGKIIGTQMGSSSQPVAEEFEKAARRRHQAVPGLSRRLNALANKTVDVALMPSNIAAVQMRKQPGAFRIAGEIGQAKLLAWVANRKTSKNPPVHQRHLRRTAPATSCWNCEEVVPGAPWTRRAPATCPRQRHLGGTPMLDWLNQNGALAPFLHGVVVGHGDHPGGIGGGVRHRHRPGVRAAAGALLALRPLGWGWSCCGSAPYAARPPSSTC